MKKTLFYLITLLILYPVKAQTHIDSLETIATQYMKAYGSWDFDKMKTFYAEDIHFEDPTALEAFGQPYIFDKKENVYNFFKNVFKGKFKNDKPPYVNFSIEKLFAIGNLVIINSTFECIVPSDWFVEKSAETVLIAIPFVTILQIEKGLIKKQTDYGDYHLYKAQIRNQINKK
jgi:ketosteroid isomerase-like protein